MDALRLLESAMTGQHTWAQYISTCRDWSGQRYAIEGTICASTGGIRFCEMIPGFFGWLCLSCMGVATVCVASLTPAVHLTNMLGHAFGSSTASGHMFAHALACVLVLALEDRKSVV